MPRTVRLPAYEPADFAVGLAEIRRQFHVPDSFPPEVLAAAHEAAMRPVGNEHTDRTDLPFVTLDPQGSNDLDQAFTIERASNHDLLLRYAIADVPWFVDPGSALDDSAWARGLTIYLPDGRSPLYPPELSERATSLLPDGPRPAIVFMVRVDVDGQAELDGVERAVIRSRAQLAYETASATDLPDTFDEFADRMRAAEDSRGAGRVDIPEQEVEPDERGGYELVFRPRLSNEDTNAALSLATNMAVADALWSAGTGLFRVMSDPSPSDVNRLRHTAKALDLEWPDEVDVRSFQRRLLANNPKHAAFLVAARRSSGGADYAPFQKGVKPWHSAMAATYSHATAPLRRLGDRYVLEAIMAVANSQPVPDHVQDAFVRLPSVMAAASNHASAVDRAAVDLVEAVVLHGREGQVFDAVVTDLDGPGVRIQLADPLVVARVPAHRVEPGDDVRVRLIGADPAMRQVHFERVG